jgi:regulator of protease activity HflC (stomatin/prohibitin superfamily)
MNATSIIILLVVVIPLVVFGVWQFLQLALVRINSGTVGLLIVRGKVSNRVLEPGVHFVWPFRQSSIQGYPLRELTYLTSDGAVDETDFADPPLRTSLGDRSPVTANYTIRFRIKPDGLLGIHDRVGPDGIKPLVRDLSRQIIIDVLAAEQYGVDDAYGARFAALEDALHDRLRAELLTEGFDVTLFNLRDMDLGPVGDVVTRTVCARMELELERVAAQVRLLRAEHEAASAEVLAPQLTDDLLRYRRIEVLREALQRWDGHITVAESAMARQALDDQTGAP